MSFCRAAPLSRTALAVSAGSCPCGPPAPAERLTAKAIATRRSRPRRGAGVADSIQVTATDAKPRRAMGQESAPRRGGGGAPAVEVVCPDVGDLHGAAASLGPPGGF